MQINEIDIKMAWGSLKAQIFGEITPYSRPIIASHGYLDNSNSIKPLAEYLTLKKQYYIISMDLPGHGFSSHLPTGIYTPKIFLICLRRLIKHFNFKSVILLAHSYSCSIFLLYGTIYPKEVDACILIDFTLSNKHAIKNSISNLWSHGIDKLVADQYESDETFERKGPLTRERALERLLSVNKAIDEESANILLDRALVEKDGKLDYSRDIRAKFQMLSGDHYTENAIIMNQFVENSTFPILYLHSEPFFASKTGLKLTLEILEQSIGSHECIGIDGTHYFHMIQPEKTGEIIENFLNENLETSNGIEVVKAKL